MGEVLPLPLRGETFFDPRGEGRSLRVSGHPDAGTVVLSVWRNGECSATFRIAGSQVDALIRALLAAAPPAAPAQPAGPDVTTTVTPALGDDDQNGTGSAVDEALADHDAESPENPAVAVG